MVTYYSSDLCSLGLPVVMSPTYVALLWIANLKCIVADMLPKSVEQVAARMLDNFSEAKKGK